MASQISHLVKIIADIAIALEFTDEKLLDPDVAIEMQESIAGGLQSLDKAGREEVASIFAALSTTSCHGEQAEYVRSLPENYGIR